MKKTIALLIILSLFTLFAASCADRNDKDEPDIPHTSEPDTSVPDTSEPPVTGAEPSTAEPSTSEPGNSDPDTSAPAGPGNGDSDGQTKPSDPSSPNKDDDSDSSGSETEKPDGKYAVVFNTDASGASYSTVTLRADSVVPMPERPTRSGYVFKGWYTGRNGSGERVSANTELSGNLTVYANWEKYEPRHIGNNIVIGCYDSFTEDQLPLVSELGLDWVFHSYDHSDVKAQTEFLDKLAANGLEAMILDQELYDLLESPNCTPTLIRELMNDYTSHKAFYGYWLEDEPDINRAAVQVKNFIKACPDILIMAELVGPQGAHVHAGVGNEDKTAENYRNWIESFISSSNTNILCDGIYPISGSGMRSTVDPMWLIGLMTGSEAAKEHNIAHSMYICCTSNVFEQGMHSFTEKDMRFQGFSALASGCSKINYFMINGYNYVLSGTNKTKQFEYIKQFNLDAHSISSVYERYNWEYSVGITADKNPERYVECIPKYLSAGEAPNYVRSIAESIKCDRNLLIGAFSEIQGPGNALFFVNQDNPNAATSRTANVTFKASAASKVTAYIDSGSGAGMRATVLECDADGVYSLSVPVGDGVMVTLDYGD